MSIIREYSMDDEDFRKISASNFQRMRRKSTKIGYADGVSNGKDETLQTAFNKGYADGLRSGFELQKYNAFSNNLKTYNEDLCTEQSLLMDLIVNTVADVKHTRPGYQNAENLDTVSQPQNGYVNHFLRQCKQNFPLTTNLLSSQNGD